MLQTVEKSLNFLSKKKNYFITSCDCFGTFDRINFKRFIKKDKPEFWAKMPSPGTEEFAQFKDFEERIVAQHYWSLPTCCMKHAADSSGNASLSLVGRE